MCTENEWIVPTYYVGVVVIESVVNASGDRPLYEERFLFVKAASEQEARAKVLQYSVQPVSYQNQYAETVTWTFKELVGVNQMVKDEIIDGTELFSRFFRNYDAYTLTFLNKYNEEKDIDDAQKPA